MTKETKEELKKKIADMEADARANDPELYETMQLIKKLTDEERDEFRKHLEAEVKRREAARA